MREFILNEETLQNCIEWCEETAESVSGKTKKKYLAELQAVKDAKEKNEKWATLIASCVFRRTYGSWERVEGNILYVKDWHYGR